MSTPQNIQDATGIITTLPGVGVMIAHGKTVPSDGADGYAPGCVFIHEDATGHNTAVYVNGGSNTAANFDALQTNTMETLTTTGATSLGAAATTPIGFYGHAGVTRMCLNSAANAAQIVAALQALGTIGDGVNGTYG